MLDNVYQCAKIPARCLRFYGVEVSEKRETEVGTSTPEKRETEVGPVKAAMEAVYPGLSLIHI